MAALLNRLGWLGVGVAASGVIANTALYNGEEERAREAAGGQH